MADLTMTLILASQSQSRRDMLTAAGVAFDMHPAHIDERALEAGDSHGGCTVHLVTADLDEGPILGQTPVAILPGDTAEMLAARVLIAEHQLYARCLAALVSRETDPVWLTAQVRALALAGGVAANSALRAGVQALADEAGVDALLPSLAMCTDNAAMIAAAGLHRFRLSGPSDLTLSARPNWSLSEVA